MRGFETGCREEGIRTLETLLMFTHFPGVLLQPLGHLSSAAKIHRIQATSIRFVFAG